MIPYIPIGPAPSSGGGTGDATLANQEAILAAIVALDIPTAAELAAAVAPDLTKITRKLDAIGSDL